MARQPRFQYPGALYHVMARGNGGDAVFVSDDDRKVFLHRLGQVCGNSLADFAHDRFGKI